MIGETVAAVIVATAGKVVDGVGDLFYRMYGSQIDQSAGIRADNMAYKRWENAVNIITKAREKIKKLGLEGQVKPPSMKFSELFIEAASLEESEDMIDLWTNLLVNSVRIDQPEAHPAFIDILKNLLPEEAKLLNALYKNGHPTLINVKYKRGCGLHIDDALNEEKIKFAENANLVGYKKAQILAWFDNLARLALIETESISEASFTSPTHQDIEEEIKIKSDLEVVEKYISLSNLGMIFMAAVTENKA